jgi:hypothetical protein
MKNRIFLVALMCLAFASRKLSAQVDVTASGGTASASYSTLAAAFTEINNGTHTGTISIGISANTTETATATLNASGSGAASYSSISISPTGGASRTISGAITAGSPLIDLSGADNVTFDGLNSGGNSLTISNTTASTTSGTCTIRFINGATGNVITKCTVEGSFNGTLATNGGSVFFSTDGSTANGNDNNTISYCNIAPAGTNLPSKGIYLNGSTSNATIANSNITIQNNNIYDFFLTTGSAGVYATTGNTDLTVRFNKLYQTGTRTYTAGGTMYGVYFSNTTYGNNINISDNTVGYASSTGTGTLTLTGSGFAGAFQGISLSIMTTSSTAYLNRNTVSDISLTSSTGLLYGIVNASGASSNTIYIDTNTVSNLTLTTSTGVCYGIVWTSATNLYARGNTVNNLSRNTGGTTYGIYSGSSSTNEYIKYNAVSNLTNTAASTSTVTMRGIYQNTATGVKEFTHNTVHSLSIPNSTATSNILIGMNINYGTTVSITDNLIYNLTGVANTLGGISTAGTSGSATFTISKNKIYGLQSTRNSATAGFCTGILISGGTSNTYNVSNNLIGDITATIASNTDAIRGLSFTLTSTSSTLNVYYNTVYLAASSTGTDFGTTGIYHAASATSTTAALTLRNNIIYNNSTAAGTGLVVAYRRSSGAANTLSNYTSTSNNNLFYAGTPSSTNLIYSDGTSTAQTMAAYKSGTFTAGNISPRETASVTESMTFQSTTGSSGNFLKYNLAVPTQAEAGALTISGYSDDFRGNTRDASTPDIGAWELSGTASDLTGPTISYTNLINTSSTSNRTTSSFATITDATGVNTTSGTRPRIYYKKSSDNNAFVGNTSGDNGWKWVQANGTSSPFDFTIDYSIINGGSVTVGDVIQYFVVAQDIVSTPNVNANPSSGFAGTSVSSISAAPTTPNSYIITSAPLSGSYNVGTSGAYTTITAAVADVVLRGVSGAVTFNLTDATYNSSETFPIVIGIVGGTSGTNKVTIKPASGVTTTISGSHATSLFTFNGCAYITLDGSNNGTTSQNMTIQNTNTTAAASVILVSGAASNSTIKNCNLTNGSVAVINYGVSVGGSTPGTGGADADNITIQNNNITSATVGIYAIGTTAVSAGGLDNLSIIGNSISYTATVSGCFGIRVGYALNSDVSQNTINIETSNNLIGGISAETGFVSSTITRNFISKVSSTTTSGLPIVRGIAVGTGQTGSAVTIANNVIYNVSSAYATTNTNSNCAGINVGSASLANTNVTTGGVNIYYNSINLYGTYDRNTTLLMYGMYLSATTSALDIRNNAISNSRLNSNAAPGTSKSYAIYSAVANTAFTTINRNNYYGSGTQGSLGFLSVEQATLSAWQTASAQDANSIASDPLFNSNTNLVPQPGSPLLNAGTPISGYSTDYTGTSRNGSTPTIGAYETAADVIGPVVSYTVLSNTGSTSNRTTSSFATITDAGSGVNTTSGTRPRLYYKKSTDNNAFVGNTSGDNGWKWVQANGTTSPFDFTIDYSIINGGSVSTGDVVQYFVVAQDLAGTPNVSASPSTGFTGTSVSSISAAPTTPNSYTIVAPLSTSINVGTGQTYTSLTGSAGLFAAINGSVLGGNTTVTVVSDLSEDGTTALNAAGMGGFTLTIVPDGSTTRVISNSTALSQAMIRLNGATGVTFDGRFSGSGQYLRIVNTHTTASSCFPAIQVLNGATSNILQNCILESNTSSSTQATVVMGSGTNSLTIKGCDLRDAQGTPGTAGVPYAAVYSNTATNTITVGGSTAADGNNIYNFTNFGLNMASVADGATVRYNNVYQTAARSTTLSCIYIAAGSNHTVSNNNIYQTSGINTSAFFGINMIGGGSGHTINNNSIGGSNASRGGAALTTNAGSALNGIFLTAGTASYSNIQGNTFSNYGNIYSSSSGSVFAINVSAGNVNIGTTSGNTIGGLASASDTILNGYDNSMIYYTGTGTVNIENNLIGNVSHYRGSNDRTAGIGIAGACTAIIKNNTIRDLKSNSNGTTLSAFSVWGIFINAAITASSNIEGNTIYNIENTNTGTLAYLVAGIRFNSAQTANVTVQRNKIYNIKANGTGTGANGPDVAGISITTGANAITISNNQIIVGTSAGADARAMGIYDNGTAAHNLYYNSIYVTGSMSSGTNNSYCVYRSGASGSTNMRNNLFYNDRSGSSGAMYAVGAASAILGATNLNYNLAIVPDTAKLVEMPTATANGWGAIGALFTSTPNSNVVELTSNVAASNLFNNTASYDLDIKTSNVASWYANGRGLQISGQTADYGSASAGRSTTVAAGGTDIGADEFTPGINPPDVTVTGSHTNSGTETFTYAGRTVATITWGASGTLPTLSSYKYWPGSWPNDPTNNGSTPSAKYAHAYWVINVTGGSGYTYDISLYYDDALLGTIASESNARLAKKQTGVNGTWVNYSTSTPNTTANTITMTGLNSFSEFTLNDNVDPLPVEWISFTGKKVFDNVELSWTTATEINNSHFEVERSTDGRNFEQVGEVKGAGNSHTPINYNYTDVTPFGSNSMLYYRLKQVDFNGEFEYSKTIAVSNNKQGNGVTIEAINPNPFTEKLNLTLNNVSEGNVTIEVYDLSGRKHYTQTTLSSGQGTLSIDLSSLSNLAKGVYIVNIKNGNEAIQQKLVKLK